jgi:uncharacterized protein YdaU (DUF1376 family)
MGAVSIPYMPLYIADYEADTAHLSPEEDGIYTRLLRLCWRTPGCSVPDDAEWLARKMRVTPEYLAERVQPIIAEFMKSEKARLFSPRLSAEFERITRTAEKRREAGKKGGRPVNGVEITGFSVKAGESKPRSKTKANGKHLDLDLDISPLPPKGGRKSSSSQKREPSGYVWDKRLSYGENHALEQAFIAQKVAAE